MMFNTDKLRTGISGIADGALIFSKENQKYFTGFSSDTGVLFAAPQGIMFFTSPEDKERAYRCMGEQYVRATSDIYETLREALAINNIEKVAIENDRLTVSELERLAVNLPDQDIIATSFLTNIIADIREIKDDIEIEQIKNAQNITDEAFSHILNFIKPGLTEKEIQIELDCYMLSHGADSISFPTIVLSGTNTSLPHGTPSEKKICQGEFITLDFGAVFGKYHSDMTRTVILGRPTVQQEQIYNIVYKAQEKGLSVLHSGVSCAEADKTAREVINKEGYGEYFCHCLGHGIGIEVHESPFLSPRSKQILEAGNVVTVEPGIYIPDIFGVRIEDTALITDKGHINLTKSPKNLIIL